VRLAGQVSDPDGGTVYPKLAVGALGSRGGDVTRPAPAGSIAEPGSVDSFTEHDQVPLLY